MPKPEKQALCLLELLIDQERFAAVFVTGPWSGLLRFKLGAHSRTTIESCEEYARYMVRDTNLVYGIRQRCQESLPRENFAEGGH